MPSVPENLFVWDRTYFWSQRGDEWSAAWGGVSHQWWTTLFPRLQGYLPAGRILEIAPGFGRWTHFLRDLCSELIIVDISDRAIAHCGERFAADRHITSHVNDGSSLAMVESESIDLAFSFDSLVHAEHDVMAGYVNELSRVLAPDGVAFLHHSNLAAYTDTDDPPNPNWRATSVSAPLIDTIAQSGGLSCVSQEIIGWGQDELLTDCFSVITRAGSRFDRENVVVENRKFNSDEVALAHRLSTLYPSSRPELKFDCEPRHKAEHARALALLAEDEVEKARDTLRHQMRRVIDPETLNDLAVITTRCGHTDDAIALLRALVHLHPEHAAAVANLDALEQPA